MTRIMEELYRRSRLSLENDRSRSAFWATWRQVWPQDHTYGRIWSIAADMGIPPRKIVPIVRRLNRERAAGLFEIAP